MRLHRCHNAFKACTALRRDFTGMHAALDYAITDAWRADAGLRFNRIPARAERASLRYDFSVR